MLDGIISARGGLPDADEPLYCTVLYCTVLYRRGAYSPHTSQLDTTMLEGITQRPAVVSPMRMNPWTRNTLYEPGGQGLVAEVNVGAGHAQAVQEDVHGPEHVNPAVDGGLHSDTVTGGGGAQ